MTAPLPPNPRAGTLKVDRVRAVERTARLLLECPEVGFDSAWRYASGFEAGRWRRELGQEVLERAVELDSENA